MFFRFTRGAVSWFYNSSDRFQTLNGDTYEPAAIARSGIKQGAENAKNKVTVTLPRTLAVAANWFPYPPSEAIVLTIFVRHVGETDALAEWVGRVVAPVLDGDTLELLCQPSAASANRRGNIRTFQRSCGHALYSQGVGLCNLDPATKRITASLTAVTGLTLTATEFGSVASGRLDGGYIEWVRPDGLVEFRSIKSHVGTSIVLDYGGLGLVTGLSISAYPGCAHTWADCGNHGNQPNYGGDLWMPITSSFDGNPVW